MKELKPGVLVHPTGFRKIFTSSGLSTSLTMKSELDFYEMRSPYGYTCLGHVISKAGQEPDKSKYCCLLNEYVTSGDLKKVASYSSFNIHNVISGPDPFAIEAGNFIAIPSNSGEKGKLLKMDEERVRDSSTVDAAAKPLELYETTLATKIWTDAGSGADDHIGIWSPGSADGCHITSHFAINNYGKPTLAYMLKATPLADFDTFSPPRSYQKIWGDAGSGADKSVVIWRPVCPGGYVALGTTATSGKYPDDTNRIDCIKVKYTTTGKVSDWKKIWDDSGSGADVDVSIFEAVTSNKDVLGVRGMAAKTPSDKLVAPIFLQSKFVNYFHEKPIKSIEMSDIKYDLKGTKRLEGPEKVFKTKVINRSYTTPQIGERTIEYSFTEESTFTFGSSISLGIEVQTSGGIPGIGGAKVTTSVTTEFSFETGSTKSETFTDSMSVPVSVPPRSAIEVFVVVQSYKADVPYTAKAKKTYVDDTISYGTLSGVWKGVQVRDAKLDYGETESLDEGNDSKASPVTTTNNNVQTTGTGSVNVNPGTILTGAGASGQPITIENLQIFVNTKAENIRGLIGAGGEVEVDGEVGVGGTGGALGSGGAGGSAGSGVASGSGGGSGGGDDDGKPKRKPTGGKEGKSEGSNGKSGGGSGKSESAGQGGSGKSEASKGGPNGKSDNSKGGSNGKSESSTGGSNGKSETSKGSSVFVGNSDTSKGGLVGHEMTHVNQQKQGESSGKSNGSSSSGKEGSSGKSESTKDGSVNGKVHVPRKRRRHG